jgi:hypothetical protein
MPISFPDDKSGLLNPGTGVLETGDLYRASNGVLYEYDADDNSWTGPTELGGTGKPEEGVPISLPRNQAFIIRDNIGTEQFLVTQASTSDDTVDDGIYVVADVK